MLPFITQTLILYISTCAVFCHTIQTETGQGYHCMNVTSEFHVNSQRDLSEASDLEPHDHCVPCFFPQNCLDNNTCAPGTYGISCEKCDHRDTSDNDYHRVGNHCVECLSGPWSVLTFGVFIVFVGLISLVNGFSVSVYTKVKIVVHFCQLLMLTFMLKITWPYLIPDTMSLLTFASFNSDFLAINCLLPDITSMLNYYLMWLTSLLVPFTVIVVTIFVDKSMALLISREKEPVNKVKSWKRRSMFRRMAFYILIVMYMPVTITGAQTNSCFHSSYGTSVMDTSQNLFLHDQDQSCDQFGLSTVQFVATWYLMIYSLIFPVIVTLLTLGLRKWSLLKEKKLQYGSIYESFKPRYCFWEAIPMLRKVIYIALTETNVISIFIQISIQLVVTGLYLLGLIFLRPYSDCHWKSDKTNINLILDVVANLVIGFLQTIALLKYMDLYPQVLTYGFLVCLVFVLLMAVTLLLFIPNEAKIIQTDINSEDHKAGEGEDPASIKRFGNKVAPQPEEQERLTTAKRNLEF